MKITLNWLRDYVALPADIDLDHPERLVEALASAGLPVESSERVGTVPGVITARVVRTEEHPEAAKVQRVWVDSGDGVEHHVWCGAFNFAAGDIVPLATLGTEMPGGMTITARGILGIKSEGMLCSPRELGLGDDHTGILVLPTGTAVGVSYGDAIGLVDDLVFELEVERNRPDAYGVVGVARDVAAYFGVAFTPPSPVEVAAGEQRSVPVEIVAGDRCGRFTTVVLSGVAVGPSAAWMQARLRAVGQRPINNVVDVSNYVMFELNHPNHPYDLTTLGGGAIRVRCAQDGERIVTLDDVERSLSADELLICDGHDAPIGLAGIMGGANTEISESTTTVALETAWFEPLGIAASVTRTGLRSEASARNDRGIDPYTIPLAVARFAELLAETCPDLVVHDGLVDAGGESLPPAERSCTLRVAQVARIVGVDLDAAAIAVLLDPIGFTCSDASSPDDGADDEEVLTVSLPSWRPDCAAEIDVIEEVARRFGYENIPRVVPLSPLHGHLTNAQQRRRLLRDVLVGLGISEVMPSPFLAAADLARSGFGDVSDVLHIVNPLVADENVLRPSLRPGLLGAVAFNASHRRAGVSLFEAGHTYRPGPGELPDEREVLGVLLAGQEAPAAVAVWRELAAALGIGARVDQSTVPAGMHATRSATLLAGREAIGALGEIAPEVLEAFRIDERVAVLELDLTTVLAAEPKPSRWKPTSRHPSSDLDVAFLLGEDVPAEKLDKAIRQSAGKLLVGLELFDVYRGDGVAEGSRSLAYRLRLQAADRTLSDTDIADTIEQVTKAAAKLGATRRG